MSKENFEHFLNQQGDEVFGDNRKRITTLCCAVYPKVSLMKVDWNIVSLVPNRSAFRKMINNYDFKADYSPKKAPKKAVKGANKGDD